MELRMDAREDGERMLELLLLLLLSVNVGLGCSSCSRRWALRARASKEPDELSATSLSIVSYSNSDCSLKEDKKERIWKKKFFFLMGVVQSKKRSFGPQGFLWGVIFFPIIIIIEKKNLLKKNLLPVIGDAFLEITEQSRTRHWAYILVQFLMIRIRAKERSLDFLSFLRRLFPILFPPSNPHFRIHDINIKHTHTHTLKKKSTVAVRQKKKNLSLPRPHQFSPVGFCIHLHNTNEALDSLGLFFLLLFCFYPYLFVDQRRRQFRFWGWSDSDHAIRTRREMIGTFGWSRDREIPSVFFEIVGVDLSWMLEFESVLSKLWRFFF